MQNQSIRTHTENGKAIARYTMVVLFYPEFRKAGSSGKWTYRPDIEREKFAKASHPLFFDSDEECLKYIFKTKFHRFKEIQKFDNSKPFHESRFEHWLNGECIERYGKKIIPSHKTPIA